jgi:hypothetical protein
MSLVTGTASNDTQTFNPGDDYNLSAGKDTLVFNQTDADLTSTTLTSVEVLKAGLSTATTFTVDPADLVASGSVVGSSGSDTLTINSTAFDLSSTALTSIEKLVAGLSSDTTFTVDAADLAAGGSIVGSSGNDTLIIKGAAFNLTSTTLTDVEKLQAGTTAATTFTINADDLAVGGEVIGNGSAVKDTLIIRETTFDLTNTTLTGIEILKAGVTLATTFTVDANDLAAGGSVIGSKGNDTLVINDTAYDLTSTTLTSVETLKAGLSTDTTFTLNKEDLVTGSAVTGSSGSDALTILGTSFDISSTAVTDVETLQAGSSLATTFTVDTADLASGGTIAGGAGIDVVTTKGSSLDLTSTTLSSIETLRAATTGTKIIVDTADLAAVTNVTGGTGTDTLAVNDSAFDLTSVTITSIEKLAAGLSTDTTFTVDVGDLASGGSVIGSSGEDTLIIQGTAFNLSSTSIDSVEVLQASSSLATTFTLDQADLVAGGEVIGDAGDDTIVAKGATLNLSDTDLTSIEILKGSLKATTFTVDQDDLAAGGSVTGSTGTDVLVAAGTELDLTSTTLNSIEKLQGSTLGTTFTVDGIGATGADLVTGGTVAGTGTSATDTLIIKGTSFDTTSTTLDKIEILQSGSTDATTFKVDQADLASGGEVVGDAGTAALDTLIIKGTTFNLTSTALTDVEILLAGSTAATTFTIDQADLAAGGSVTANGSTVNDTLIVKDATVDLTDTTLTGIEILKAGINTATNFIVDSADLASGGSVIGSSGADTLTANGAALDLTSTTLTSVEKLAAGSTNATTFTVNMADLASGGSVTGNTGSDTLVITGTSFDLSSTSVTGVEKLQTASSLATTFTVNQADLASGGTIIGGAGSDTLTTKETALDLTSTTLTSIEALKAGTAAATKFTLDTGDFGQLTSISGSTGSDTLVFTGTAYDLSSRALTSIEVLEAGSTSATTFTVDAADLASGGSVKGNTGVDTLTILGTAFNLASTGINSVEILKGGSSLDTTFTLDQADLVSGGSVVGSTGTDTIIAKGATLDLSSTSLTSIEKLQGTLAATTFTVDQADLNSVTSITGSTGNDTVAAGGAALDLTSTTLSSIETLRGAAAGTTFTVDGIGATGADLVAGGSIIGASSTTTDTLIIKGTSFDTTSTTLTNIEVLKAGSSLATTFTIDQADLASGGTVQGSTGTDTLVIKGTALNLASTTLDNVEELKAGSSSATTFTLDGADLADVTAITGSSGNDTLVASSANIDLSSTALNSIEILKAGLSVATTFTVDQADLASGGSVQGSSGIDTLVAAGATLDLTSTTLSSIEKLQASAGGTTFTLDTADLASGGSVVGDAGTDTLIIKSAAFDLSSSAVTGVEVLQAGSSLATTFTVDAGDLASGGTIQGSSGSDTLTTKGTLLDLTSTTLNSIETLKAGSSQGTTFNIDTTDFASLTAIIGSSGNDTLSINGTDYDLSSTALTSIETLQAGSTDDTTFTVDQGDLASGGSVVGNTGNDTLAATGATLDLTSTTLNSVEVLKAASTGTAFTVDTADLAVATDIAGDVGTDTLVVKGTSFDLTSTAVTDVEILKAGSSLATTFTVDQTDLYAGGTVQGSSGTDTLAAAGTELDLTSTTLSSIEKLQASSTGTTFTVDAADLANIGSVTGGAGTDALIIKGVAFDVTSTALSSVEKLTAGSSLATTFTVDQADLTSGGSIIGSSGIDTLTTTGTALSLANTSLTSVEILQAGSSLATTFTVDNDDLTHLTTINGSSGVDTLVASSSSANLSSTTLSSIEVLKAGLSTDTVFTVDQADLANGGSVQGSSGSDSVVAAGTEIDLTSTTLTSIEKLVAGSSLATTFKVDQADLASGGEVTGSSGIDTLVVTGVSADLRSTATTSIEILKASSSLATTFTVDQADLASGGSVVGSSGTDVLTTTATALDLTSTTLTSVETLQAGSSLATTFTVDGDDFTKLTSIVGSSGSDTLSIKDTAYNLSSTALTSIENLQAGSTLDTTFTVDQSDLANGSSVIGNTGTDTLIINGISFDVSSVTLTSVEKLQAGSSLATTFTVNQADLASGGTVQGNSGNDTLTVMGTALDLTSTTLTSVETLKAGLSLATAFTVDASDLAAAGSVTGSSGNDSLTIVGTAFDVSSTTLTSIESLIAGSTLATTFTVDQGDLTSGGSVTGNAGTDTLIVKGLTVDLTSTTVSNVEILQASSNLATTFTVDAADLASGGTVQGGSANDTLVIKGTAFNLSSTTLNSIETLKAGVSLATTFTLDAADLASGGTLTGSTGVDTLVAAGTTIDLSSTAVSNIEILKAGSSLATTFTLDGTDLGGFGTITGSSGADTLEVKSATIDLSLVNLSNVEILKAGLSVATTFTVDQADLASNGTVQGSSGNDTLTFKTTAIDLTSTTLTSVEILKTGNSLATTFTVDQADLVSGGTVQGSSGTDTLVVKDAAIDLTSTTLSSIEILKAGSNAATTFTVDAADLASGGSVVGSTGSDVLVMKTTAFDLSSTSLTSIETLQAGSSLATTFTVDQADLAASGSVTGSSGNDILVAAGASLNLSSTTLNSIEILKAGSSLATTFTVDQADLANGGTVQGSSGNDSLVIAGTSANLTSTTLSSIEILKAASSLATTFTVDQADLASSGTVQGSSGTDSLVINGTSLDLTSTSLDSVEIIQAGSGSNTTFTLDQADLVAGGSVVGSSGTDILAAGFTSLDLSSTTLSSIENLKASLSIATIFTVDENDLVSGGSVTGSSGNDTLAIVGTSLDLTSVTLTSVEVLKAASSLGTTFTVDAVDLASGGSVIGSSGNDTLVISNNTAFNLSSTTLSSVEVLKAGTASATTFTVDQADLIGGGSIIGSSGSDTLTAFGTSLDLSNTSLDSIELLKAGSTLATTFIVDQADLIASGSVTGSTGSDILQASGTLLDLSSTTLTSIEQLKAGLTLATTFVVDQADLATSGSVIGNTGIDTLTIAGNSLDLSSTAITSVEILKAGSTNATTFTVDAADLLSGGSVVGNTGNDTLVMKTTAFNMSSTTLTSVDILQAGLTTATTFTLDQADLASGGSIIGSSGSDTVTAFGTVLDLSSTTLTSVERLLAGSSLASIFTVDQADLSSVTTITGSSGNDTLAAGGTSLNLTSTAVTSFEILKAATSLATTFTVDTGDLTSGGSVVGSSGNDTLVMNTTAFNMASTTLTSVEILQAGLATATTFTVDAADLAAGGSVIGSSGSDTLTAFGTVLDLSSTTLTSVERLLAGSSLATTFTVDQNDLSSLTTITGSSGNDTLTAGGTQLNLTSTAVTSVEILKAGTSLATTFTVDTADLTSGGTVIGSSGTDTLVMNTTAFNMASTTLTSIEILQAGLSTATTFTVDQADLISGGSVVGSSGADILAANGTTLDLSSTSLSSIETIRSGSVATTFTLDQADLASVTAVTGSTGSDILVAAGTELNLSSAAVTSVETIRAGLSLATTFTVDQADLTTASSVTGSTGTDTLAAAGTALDLSSTTLTSIEILRAANTAGTTFTVDPADLLSGGSVIGNTGIDTLAIKLSTVDLTSTTLTSIEIIDGSLTTATLFTVNQADLASGGTVSGNAAVNDTLTIAGTSLDLSSSTLSSVEIITTNSTLGTTFIVDQADLASTGSVTSNTNGTDTLVAAGSSLDLSSTVLTSIEKLQAGTSIATTFTVDAADLAASGSVIGSSGLDSLVAKYTGFDLTSTTLTSIERLTAGLTTLTTFTVNQADLISGGSVTGTAANNDILTISGTSLDLSSTTLTSVESIKAGLSTATTFLVDQTDLLTGGSVTGSSGNDTLAIAATSLDLSSTSLSSVEIIRAGLSTATTFTVDAADLLSGGSVIGSSGSDTLVMTTSAFNLSSTSLTSVEILRTGVSVATTFTVDLADLVAGGSVVGSSGNDTLLVRDANYDLTNTTLTGIEILQAGLSLATVFTVDQADLIGGGTVAGSTGTDTLAIAGSALDLTSTTLTSVEIIRAGSGVATTFTLDASDLASGGTVWGSSGNDRLVLNGTAFDLTSTALTSVEILQTGSSLASTFTLDASDLLSGGSVVGSTGTDTLSVLGTSVDLTSTTLTSIELLKTVSSLATTFLVDQADLLSGGSVTGSTGSDILSIVGSSLDLTSTTLNSIEILQAGTGVATTFIVDQADLLSAGSVVGNSGIDTLAASSNAIDLTSTTLSSIEVLKANSVLATTFTVDQADLISGGSVTGNIAADTLVINGTSLDLTSTTLNSVEFIRAGLSTATTFTVDQADLLANGAVIGSSGNDTLVTNGTSLDLSSTSLSSVEIIKAGSNLATTFTVDQDDLATGGSVVGGAGSDTLIVNGHSIDLSNTVLTSIETIQSSAPSSASNFAVGGGIGGATIDLTSNGVIDTVSLATGYKVADVTSDATILSHSVTLNHFTDGSGGDVIDLSAITNGTPTSSTDISGYINLAAPATLKDALNIAATANGSSTASVVTFQYGGDTYVLVDNSASNSLTTDDVVVKLVGTHTLSDASNITF